MGVLTRPLLRPAQRFDLEDYNVQLSALRSDSHFYTQRFLSPTAYILQGFTIDQSFIGQPTADISLTNATAINGNNTGDISWWTAPEMPDPLTIPVGVGGLQAGRNYVELEIYAVDGTPLQRAFWDPTANSGAGVEFTQEVNTVTEMFVKVHVNQTGFTGGNPNYMQLSIIDLDGSSNIKGIQDKRKLFYRLGTPDDIHASFAWGSRTEPTTLLTFTVPAGTPFVVGETVTFTSGATATVVVGGTNNIEVFDFSTVNYEPGDIVSGGTSSATATLQSYYESFTGADKDITSYKAMFSALENEIRLVKGTNFWYEAGNVLSLASLLNFLNAITVPVSSGARISWSGTALKITDNMTSGQSTSDVVGAIRIPGYSSNLYLTRQDGTGGSSSLTIPDKSILWVELPAYGSSRTYSEQGPNPANYRITAIASFIPSDKNHILAYREGNRVIVLGMGELEPGESGEIGDNVSKELLAFIGAESEASTNPQYTTVPSADLSNQFTTNDSLTQAISVNAANINDIASAILTVYQEFLVVVSGAPSDDHEATGPISGGTSIDIPLDSRDSNNVKYYRVGSGGLIVELNGVVQVYGADYVEVGSPGSLSTQIQMTDNLVIDDRLNFRIINPQFLGAAASDQPFFVNYITGQNGTGIPVGHIYNIGTERLQVWRDGLAMNNTISIGVTIDQYQEDTANAIVVEEAANPDEVFQFVNTVANPGSVTLQTGISGSVITVPTYVIGNGSLRVFRNGVLMSPNPSAPTDQKYVETSTTSITLALAATSPDVFKIYIGTIPTWRHILTGVTGTNLTIPGGDSYVMGNQKLLVFKNGVLMYNSTSPSLGEPGDRYQEASTTTLTLEDAAVSLDFFEFIYV